ncbi:MAG TPA: hypothetical protein VGK99_20350 [Acidobacteriota bacterium]
MKNPPGIGAAELRRSDAACRVRAGPRHVAASQPTGDGVATYRGQGLLRRPQYRGRKPWQATLQGSSDPLPRITMRESGSVRDLLAAADARVLMMEIGCRAVNSDAMLYTQNVQTPERGLPRRYLLPPPLPRLCLGNAQLKKKGWVTAPARQASPPECGG